MPDEFRTHHNVMVAASGGLQDAFLIGADTLPWLLCGGYVRDACERIAKLCNALRVAKDFCGDGAPGDKHLDFVLRCSAAGMTLQMVTRLVHACGLETQVMKWMQSRGFGGFESGAIRRYIDWFAASSGMAAFGLV